MIKTIPLTESQRGVYMECIQHPESTMYNLPFLLPVPEAIDHQRFIDAVKTVFASHPSFFISIGVNDGEPVMVVEDNDFEQRKQMCTICFRDVADKETTIKEFIRPFDIEHETLYRMDFCHAPEGDFLLLDIHHLIFDGTSFNIFLRHLIDAYEGREVSSEQFSIFDLAQQEIELKTSDTYRQAQQFFKDNYGEVEFDNTLAPDLPIANPDRSEANITMESPEGLSIDDIDRFNRQNDISNNAIYNAAFAYTLAKYNGLKESCYTTVTNGRSNPQLADTFGMFVRSIPLHFEINEDSSVIDFLRQVKDTFYATKKHDCISFGELVENYGISSDVAFAYHGQLFEELTVDGTKVLPLVLPSGGCSSNIICELFKTQSKLRLIVYYRRQLYSEEFARNIAQTYFKVLDGLIHCERLRDIQLVSEQQKDFIDSCNATENPYDQSLTVDDLLCEAIRKHPDKTMLVYKDRSYTYSQFDRLTKNIAAYIHGKGIGTDNIVAILAPRCDYMIIAAWGAIRAGAAFQALDPTYPAERINYMIADSKSKLLIVDKSLFSLVEGYDGELLFIDDMMQLPDAGDFHVDVRPEDAITMIYTSGTTGKPKGCILENRNLLAIYQANIPNCYIDENCRVASYSSFGFDAGIHDVFIPPMSGGTVYIIPDEIRLDFMKIDEFFAIYRRKTVGGQDSKTLPRNSVV